jgi:hypothetical protein
MQRPSSILPQEWSSISSVEEIHPSFEAEIKPISSSEDGGPRRARSAGRIHSLLRVTSPESPKEVYLGLALLRLETLSKGLETTIAEKKVEDAAEAGVNAAGGFSLSPELPASLCQEWKVASFKDSQDL